MANDKDPLLGALGICRKAGKLLHGYDRVEEAVMRGKACLVLLACDASKRTTQHMQDTCRGVIPCAVMPLKGEDLRMLTPKPAAVFAVTDENLAHLCAGYLKKQVKEDSANGRFQIQSYGYCKRFWHQHQIGYRDFCGADRRDPQDGRDL